MTSSPALSGAAALAGLADRPESERAIGPFRLVRQLGKGGFAPVWAAREVYGDIELRTVAVKLFATGAGPAARGARDAIVREARALCRVEHPNVVRFFAIAEDPTRRLLGLVMEHVEGTSLDRRLEAGPLSSGEALDVGRAVAAALAAVHAAGLVHRDVKPGNVLEASGVHKLIDFGIAGAALRAEKAAAKKSVVVDDLPMDGAEGPDGGGDGDEPPSGSLSGTLGYMDPACVDSASPATAASDLYALGATLYECLCGVVPAVAASRAAGRAGLSPEVLDGRAKPPPVVSVAAETDPGLAKLVDALVDPDPVRRPRTAEIVAWEIERLRRNRRGAGRPLPPEDVGPFRGLDRFEPADRDVYFGRTSEIAAALEMLRVRGLVALVGASGSGKSSLARAGVAPAVGDGELGGWPPAWDTLITTPGISPRKAILEALRPLEVGSEADADGLADALAERVAKTSRGVLLVVDQLEELTAAPAEGDRAFVTRLLARIGGEPRAGVRVLVTVRRDRVDSLLATGEIGRSLLRGTILVDPLSDATWIDVVECALDMYGYRLEDDALREALAQELATTGSAMPLVQFALARLWERRDREKKLVTRAALREIGGIAGGLAQHADATLDRIRTLDPTLDVARRLLLLHTSPEGTRVSRRLAELEDLCPSVQTEGIMRELERARLVVREGGRYTLSHETLLAQWGALRGWIAEARDDRALAEEVERDAEAWLARPDPERLWKGRRLHAAEDLADKASASELSAGARSFVRTGRRASRRASVTQVLALAIVASGAAALGGMWVRSIIVAERVRAAQAVERADVERTRAEAERVRADAARAGAASAEARATEAGERAKIEADAAEKARSEREKLVRELERRRIPVGSVQLGPVEVQGKGEKR